MEFIDRIKSFELVQPSERIRRFMEKWQGRRNASLSDVHRGGWMDRETECVWCDAPIVDKRRRKYCSPPCNDSSSMYFNPQSNGTKMYLLLFKQQCACAGCGLSFESYVEKRIEKYKRVYGTSDKPSLWYLGYNTGHLLHVDHIVPIFKGGQSLGIKNLQVLCVPCHKEKTAQERKNEA